MKWRKTLWGVKFSSPLTPPMLLGAAWHELGRVMKYAGEPTRALLFETREDARAYCSEQRRKNEGRNDCCATWRFKPVRVVETVRPI
jgi:hypothetical protein